MENEFKTKFHLKSMNQTCIQFTLMAPKTKKGKKNYYKTFFHLHYNNNNNSQQPTTKWKIPNSFSINFYHYWYHYIFETLQNNLICTYTYMLGCKSVKFYLFKTCSIQLTTNKQLVKEQGKFQIATIL